MIRRFLLSAFTPSNTDPKLLERIFVQREKLLHAITNRLARSMTSGEKHHVLLIGPRGSGKTNLVTLVVHRLRQRDELNDTMRVAWLGEDDVMVELIDIALAIADCLAEDYPDEFLADVRSTVRGLSGDDAAIAVLNLICDQLQYRNLLVVMENLDRVFAGLGDLGQKRWRAFLQETTRIATLATSQQVFEGVSSRNEAFFGFFDLNHLTPLSVDDACALIRKIATEQGKLDLVKFLDSPTGRYRIRALHHLAGGNHRMYVLLSEYLTKDSLDDLVESFEQLAEELTPYFQERLRSVPPQQAKLVQCLANSEGAKTVKEIAEETFIAERNCSKQLGNLRQSGYVISSKRGKESYYELAEPLMRLCLEVKNQRGRPLKLVAKFLKVWFPASSLDEPMAALGETSATIASLREAFETGDSSCVDYGGTPGRLLSIMLRHTPMEWSDYANALVPLFVEHGVGAKLGKGIVESIGILDEGEFSDSQLELWNDAWQSAGKKCDELELPLRCLDAAVEMLQMDKPSDRPLFCLPLEIRGIVRDLLTNTLGPTA